MTVYDANNPRHVRVMRKVAKEADRVRGMVISDIMSTPAGREFFYDLLTLCHVFSTSFTGEDAKTNFNEGERNVGLRIWSDITVFCPHEINQMMKEANERAAINDSRLSRSDEDAGQPDRTSGGRERAVGDDFGLEPDLPNYGTEPEPGEQEYDLADE